MIVDTNFVPHEVRGMKTSVTIVLSRDAARWVRVEAARREMSVSRYLGELVEREREREREEGYEAAMRSFLSRAPRVLGPPGEALPGRAERHER